MRCIIHNGEGWEISLALVPLSVRTDGRALWQQVEAAGGLRGIEEVPVSHRVSASSLSIYRLSVSSVWRRKSAGYVFGV